MFQALVTYISDSVMDILVHFLVATLIQMTMTLVSLQYTVYVSICNIVYIYVCVRVCMRTE